MSSSIEPVVEPGQDFTELVTVAELGIVSRQLGADPIGEIESGGSRRWEAMARLGWVLERRRDPKAAVDRWLELTLSGLLDALAIDPGTHEATTAAAQAADDANPTAPGPA